jgi:hypothetical protein
MNNKYLYFCATVAILATAPAQADAMFQCVDENGHKSFSNMKSGPKGAKCTPMPLGKPKAQKLKIGDQTSLGLVTEIKLPIVKVQSKYGERWVRIEELD